ncbi:MAG: MBL fold metallo-hydrolase [Planctomycetota bacterium]|jgi:7,8-dihydropterin-6-yl-methyl-4-(beta-D-ribofuranosyl)aminobenzene 5'-phosphate synthase
MRITILYDNKAYKQDLDSGWGFSCLVAGLEKTILFDTGPSGYLLGNMEKLKIEPNSIDTVVLSHIHPDHTGGLESFLEENSEITVYLPNSFPEQFKDNVQARGAKIFEVDEPVKICDNVWSTGQLGKWIYEQSLIIRTVSGLIVLAGCSHSGIVNILKKGKELIEDDLLFVMGGFHLEWVSKGRIQKIISSFKKIGVPHVGLCHGSGDRAMSLFKEYFGRNYIHMGAGREIFLSDLC